VGISALWHLLPLIIFNLFFLSSGKAFSTKEEGDNRFVSREQQFGKHSFNEEK